MTNIQRIVIEQLAIDYNVNPMAFEGNKPEFSLVDENKTGKRKNIRNSRFLYVLCLGYKLIFCGNSEIISWCREYYENYPAEWFMNFQNLNQLNSKINNFGYRVSPYSHHYYIPTGIKAEKTIKYKIKWLEHNMIKSMGHPQEFKNAFFKNIYASKQIGIACYDKDEIISVATATKVGRFLWELAVDTKEEYRKQGIASQLISRLSNKLLSEGNVCFYGTAESNIISQKVAYNAGFLPFWAEVYTEKI